MRRAATVAATAVAILFVVPAGAIAQRHIVQPGDPGSAQYQEDIPTASGSRPVSTLHPSTTPQTAIVLPRSAVHALAKDGAAGRSTTALAQATAPPPSPPPSVSAPATAHSSPTRALSYRAAGTAGVLVGALLGSGGGMGVFLPILLGLALGAAVALTLGRRKRS